MTCSSYEAFPLVPISGWEGSRNSRVFLGMPRNDQIFLRIPGDS